MKVQLTNLVMFLMAAIILTGCPSTMNMKEVEVDVMNPAEIILPDSVSNLLILDRTVYTGNPFDSNEALLVQSKPVNSGPGGSPTDAVIFHLQRYLGGSTRFQTVVASEALTGNSISKALPKEIPWETVNALCNKYGANALVAVEVYDYTYNVSNARVTRKERSILNQPQDTFTRYSPYDYTVAGIGNVVFGFRIYDPSTETILDEHIYRHRETWESTADNEASAASGLPPAERAVQDLIHLAGMEYAKRIAPIPLPVTRKYYAGTGDSALAKGTELAEAEQWLQAAEAWQAGINGD
ncbi:MAG: hypothetical protein HKN08_06345, partial [Gammaproteobacteria bacterium]|nr:hypothetical protein [Gammaproteobacteria bacterium]